MTVLQVIRVHGYPFQVVSDQRIADPEKQCLVEAMAAFGPRPIRVLSEGKSGEPPLRIIIGEYDQWKFWTRSWVTRQGLPDRPKGPACYRVNSNELFLSSPRILQSWQMFVMHEMAHVLDDFAVTRFQNFSRIEEGLASIDYFKKSFPFISEDVHYRNAILIGLQYYYGGSFEWKWEEAFAATVAFLIDPQREKNLFETMVRVYQGKFQGKFQTTTEFEFQNPFVQSVKTFLANYPHIPGVPLEEQYDTSVWLPILRIRLW